MRKEKDAGPVTIREPGTNETHTGYIKNVNQISYRDGGDMLSGIELVYERWSVAA